MGEEVRLCGLSGRQLDGWICVTAGILQEKGRWIRGGDCSRPTYHTNTVALPVSLFRTEPDNLQPPERGLSAIDNDGFGQRRYSRHSMAPHIRMSEMPNNSYPSRDGLIEQLPTFKYRPKRSWGCKRVNMLAAQHHLPASSSDGPVVMSWPGCGITFEVPTCLPVDGVFLRQWLVKLARAMASNAADDTIIYALEMYNCQRPP